MWNKRDVNVSNEDDKNQSRINAAGLINSTLEKLWVQSYEAMARGSYILWNTRLDSIWAILGGDVKNEDDDDNKFNDLSESIYKEGSLSSKTGSGFGSKINENNAMQYQLLLKKSLFLRRLQNKQGKGTAYTRDDDDDFD